jgi:hypothetical protein
MNTMTQARALHAASSRNPRSARLTWLVLLGLCACGNAKSRPPSSIIDDDASVDEPDADEPDADAGSEPQNDGGGEVDAGELIGDGNCTGDVFRFDSVRSAGRRLSLLVHGGSAHLVYPTPSCDGTSGRSLNQALSHVSLGVTGEPSAPRALVNGASCAVTRDPALYTDGDALRLFYTTNAWGSYELSSVGVLDDAPTPVQVTSQTGNEFDTAVAEIDGKPRGFFSREAPGSTGSAAAPIVSVADAAFTDTLAANARVSELAAAPLLDKSFGAIAYPSLMSSAPGVYLTLVDATGAAKAQPVQLTAALGAGSAAALAWNDDGGAVIYSEVPGGTAHQLRFRAIDRTGAVGAPVKLTTGNQDLRDLALAPFKGGYLAAYRRTSAGEGLSATMRLLFVDEQGTVEMNGYVADASSTEGSTQLAIAEDDDTFFVAWSNVESVSDGNGSPVNVERVSLARFRCTSVPELTCDD